MNRHKVYRIDPGFIRSQKAYDSWKHIPVIDVPWVKCGKPDDFHCREIAASLAHAKCLIEFLGTFDSHCIVIEDDTILIDESWMGLEYDLFQPFYNHRSLDAGHEFHIIDGQLPIHGCQAYIASREFAIRYIPHLVNGRVCDIVNKEASNGMKIGMMSDNAILHDNFAKSFICERRRKLQLEMRGVKDES